jgi:hypothetical protein
MSFTGTTGLVQYPDADGWDPRMGPTIVRRWKGSEDRVREGASQLRRAGIRYQVEPSLDGGYWVLTGTSGAEETQDPMLPLSDEWSLVGNDLEKSIWDHPRIKEELDKAVTDENGTIVAKVAYVRAAVDAFARGEATIVDSDGDEYPLTYEYIINSLVAELGGTPNVATWEAFIKSRCSGVESYSVSQWVLRHTIIIAANSTIKPSLINVGKVFTTQMVQLIENIPATLKFDLPQGWWLKRTPTVEQTSADKFTITQEFWHGDAFDPFVYEVAS